jgi:hypothetical protein
MTEPKVTAPVPSCTSCNADFTRTRECPHDDPNHVQVVQMRGSSEHNSLFGRVVYTQIGLRRLIWRCDSHLQELHEALQQRVLLTRILMDHVNPVHDRHLDRKDAR